MITYNHNPFIVKAIQGVLHQKTSYSYELVIGEDFSTDGTREIVNKYAEEYPEIIRPIMSSKNVGAKKKCSTHT
jgi:glycosyltransferase involved in cell wall biosynthesis